MAKNNIKDTIDVNKDRNKKGGGRRTGDQNKTSNNTPKKGKKGSTPKPGGKDKPNGASSIDKKAKDEKTELKGSQPKSSDKKPKNNKREGVSSSYHFSKLGAVDLLKIQPATKVACSTSTCAAKDKYQELLMVDLWLTLFSEHGIPIEVPSRMMRDKGIPSTIRHFDEMATALLHQRPLDLLTSEILRACDNSIAVVVQLLRFPKRFTYMINEPLKEQMIREFKSANRHAKHKNHKELPLWLVQRLKWISRMVIPQPKNIKLRKPDIFHDIPGGASADAGPTRILKFLEIESVTPFGILPRGNINQHADLHEACDYSVPGPVPKNYKSFRMVAPEPVLTQFKAKPLAELITQRLDSTRGKFHPGKRVIIHDIGEDNCLYQPQERNRELSRQGSIDGSLVTIDLSAASDSISYQLVEIVLGSYFKELLKVLPTKMKLDGRIMPKFICLTMGHRVTFPLESLIFWIICCAAASFAEDHFGVDIDYDKMSVYGDDIIVPADIFDVVSAFLTVCGFTVNEDKTCINAMSPIYRESCGSEWIDGHDISSIYWPRQEIKGNDEDIETLVSLHNRLYKAGFLRTASRLAGHLYRRFPKLIGTTDEREFGILQSVSYHGGAKLPPSVEYTAVDTEGNRKKVTVPGVSPVTKIQVANKVSKGITEYPPYTRADVIEAEDRYLYFQYLSEGPLYADGLDRLLGVSTSRRSKSLTHATLDAQEIQLTREWDIF